VQRTNKKRPILTLAGVRRQGQLTPKEKILYKEVIRMRKRLSVKKRLKYAKNSIMTGHWEGVDKLDPVTVNFFKSQLRNLDKNKYKRTFSLDDKILALAIFKKSPKTYRFLSNLFTLPSAETIRKVVRHIPITAGIYKFLLNVIKIKVKKMNNAREKCCILLFSNKAKFKI
jgi:hypothetical protein